MHLIRFAPLITFALSVTSIGCSSTDAGLAEENAGVAQQSAGYGYEFFTDRLTPRSSPAPEALTPPSRSDGRLAPETIRDVVRAGFGQVRACYEKALQGNPALQGQMTMQFVIRQDGAVQHVHPSLSGIEDAAMVECVSGSMGALRFPASGGGLATVVYPLEFVLGDNG